MSVAGWPAVSVCVVAYVFVMVGGLVHTGVVGAAAVAAVGDNVAGAPLTLLVGGAALSALVDNIASVTAVGIAVAAGYGWPRYLVAP